MGKRTKSREARRQEMAVVIHAVLKSHARVSRPAGVVARFADFEPHYQAKFKDFHDRALRAPDAWRCRIKSRSQDKRFIDCVRFTFARYRVPAHLEQVWINDCEDDFTDRITQPNVGQRGPGAPDLRLWYMTAAQGGSLYKQASARFLSKQETHFFLTVPDDIVSTRQAFWYAVARAQTDWRDVAVRIARSKIASYSIASVWWKEVARFFARNPMPAHEMDDLIDFLFVAKQEDAGFTLKGRTLAALRRRMEQWHRTLRKSQVIGGGAWAGSPLPDVVYTIGGDERRAVWRVRQIKTGNALVREGERMHHCVATYKDACLAGDISIWSLASEFPLGCINRGVTMEVTRDGRIVQCRGFANRLPYANEVAMAKRWACEHGLTWAAMER